ncbi:hypothetical protein ACFQX7_27640 [Luedemannella flava]
MRAWFWPLDKVAMLDGTASDYGSGPVVTWLVEEPVHEVVYAEQGTLDLGITEPLTLPSPGKQIGKRARKRAVPMRPQVPLANLDDWIDFLEAMLGRHDIPLDSLHAEFETLAQLEHFEEDLPGLMVMDRETDLADRFPWLTTASLIADDQAFFHWELHFAQAFARGGYDLQVGNPPWVRPIWKDEIVLGEHDPWLVLKERVPQAEKSKRKQGLLASPNVADYMRSALTASSADSAFLGASSIYPLLSGTQTDLYRVFMLQTWRNARGEGAVGLIHPDTHFSGTKEGDIRSVAYRRLRLHANFINKLKLFPEIHDNKTFGLHIYGSPRDISFAHLSWLFSPDLIVSSLEHSGEGAAPGYRYRGAWDQRPHLARVVEVNRDRLRVWQNLVNVADDDVERAPTLSPITLAEDEAIAKLASWRRRLRSLTHWISPGYHEGNAKKTGLIRWDQGQPPKLTEVVLQGPHFAAGAPISKRPRVPYLSNNDWDLVDLESVSDDYVPFTNYVLSGDEAVTRAAQDVWNERRYTAHYRLVWRKMIDPKSAVWSLFAALMPPGPRTSIQFEVWPCLMYVRPFWRQASGHLFLLITSSRSQAKRTSMCLMPLLCQLAIAIIPLLPHYCFGRFVLIALQMRMGTSGESSANIGRQMKGGR